MSENGPQDPVYTPAAILNVFNNAIVVKETRQLVKLKGIYTTGRGANYGGMFYDSLKDETTDAQLTLIVPALLREKLKANTTIECSGFINRRVTLNASRIEIQMQLTEITGTVENAFSDEEIKAMALQQQKAANGYRDVTGYLKAKLSREERANIAILVGRNSIIEHDIKHALKEAIGYYDIVFAPVNLSNEFEIMRGLDEQSDMDVIVIARGGGENLDIFNRTVLAEKSLEVEPYFITAIGHEQDTPLLQKMADKAFITPTAFGNFLYDLFIQTAEELQHSKAKMIDSIKKELATNYEQQLQTQAAQLHQTNLLLEQAREMAREKAKPNVALVVLLLLAGMAIGAIIVYWIKHSR